MAFKYQIVGDKESLGAIKSVALADIDRLLMSVQDSRYAGTGEGEATISVSAAFATVPWLFRGVTLRADAVSSMPYTITRGKEDVTESPEYLRLTGKLRRLLWITEASLVTTGAAYWFKQNNQFDLETMPRWMMTRSITPIIDDEKGLVGFKRKVGTREINYPVDKFVYFWVQSLEEELGPGIAPASVALAASGVLANSDRMIEAYFKRGAIKVTILGVPDTTRIEEIRRLERWWKKLASGIGNAMTAIGLRSDVKPQVIGSDLKDTSAPELTDKKREDIATALSIPQSLLWQASAYATARHEERLAFNDMCVIPECTMIAEVMNEQLFNLEGLQFAFTPEKLPIMQDAQLDKATALKQLIPQSDYVLTQDEARALMGREPIPEEEKTKPKETELPDDSPDELEQESQDTQDESREMMKAMRQWRDKATKRAKIGKGAEVEFETDAIPRTLKAAIAGALMEAHTTDDVRGVFADAMAWKGYP